MANGANPGDQEEMSAEEAKAAEKAKAAEQERRHLEKEWFSYIDEVSLNHPGYTDAQMEHEAVLWHERQGITDKADFFGFPWELSERPKPVDPAPESSSD